MKSVISIFLGLFLLNDQSIEVRPAQIEINSSIGQIVTSNIFVRNLSADFVSLKTTSDSTWISVFPSQFILLPGQEKSVLIIFSINKNVLKQQTSQIKFSSAKGGEKKVLIKISIEAEKTSEMVPQITAIKSPSKDLNQRIEAIIIEMERLELDIANLRTLINKYEIEVEKLLFQCSQKNLLQK